MSSNILSPARGGSRAEASKRGRLQARLHKVGRNPKFWFGLIVLAPTLAWYMLFAFLPIINALPLSLQYYALLDPAKSRWVGFENFRMLFDNPLFMPAVRNTIAWAVLGFTLGLIAGMGIALCLVSVTRGRNLYQGLIYLPAVVSFVAVALLFRILLEPQTGQVNLILNRLHLPEGKWLTSSDSALVTSVLIGVWKGIGGTVIILTAGMLNVPEELYDAAKVDGVNSWQKFWKVTLPLMSHTLLLVTILGAIGSLQVFTEPTVLTAGGPGNATFTYNMLVYRTGFNDMQLGVASAAAMLQFVVIVTISLLQLKLFRPKWSY
jgi:ABC-type sugar transport system permease subunit